MKIAIWSVTRRASKSAIEINKKFESDVFILEKFCGNEKSKNIVMIKNFTESLENMWDKYDAHIFIMATGIVVRKISKLIKSKDIDPAVCVVDENMRFVISLLSGHLGGANNLAYTLSEKFNLLPIVTTSSDITGKIAIDTIAQQLKLEMENLEKAKNMTSLIVDNKVVDLLLPKNIKTKNSGEASGVAIISNKESVEIMRLYPKNLILGIGCKRDTQCNEILKAIDIVFKKNNLSKKSIKLLATVDIKSNEIGLLQACKILKKDLIIVERDDIKKIQDKFIGSDFVEKQIGVRCVSEPVAYITSNKNGKFIEKKFIYNGITISIYEEKFDE